MMHASQFKKWEQVILEPKLWKSSRFMVFLNKHQGSLENNTKVELAVCYLCQGI